VFKNIIIAVLAVVLCAGAISSRPGEDSFKAWYRGHAQVAAAARAAAGEHRNLLQKIFNRDESPESYLERCVYKDRVLWADIEVNGKVVASGAFSRWVSYEDVNAAIRAKTAKG
jgi:hypothetical protein